MNAASFVSAPKMSGVAYIEVLVATALVVMALLPALDALRPGSAAAGAGEEFANDYYQLAAKLEAVLAEPFDDLDAAAVVAGSATTPTSYSDTYTYSDGRQITREVFVSRYDADNADGDGDPFTGIDRDLLWVSVQIPGFSLGIEALKSAYTPDQ
jgi:hypothetical protein